LSTQERQDLTDKVHRRGEIDGNLLVQIVQCLAVGEAAAIPDSEHQPAMPRPNSSSTYSGEQLGGLQYFLNDLRQPVKVRIEGQARMHQPANVRVINGVFERQVGSGRESSPSTSPRASGATPEVLDVYREVTRRVAQLPGVVHPRVRRIRLVMREPMVACGPAMIESPMPKASRNSATGSTATSRRDTIYPAQLPLQSARTQRFKAHSRHTKDPTSR
jgi:hypothetical protein